MDIEQVRKIRRQVFFTKLTMQNIEKFCFVSIVKKGPSVVTQFLSHLFEKKFEKSKNSEKQRKSKKICFFNIFVLFLASSEKNF